MYVFKCVFIMHKSKMMCIYAKICALLECMCKCIACANVQSILFLGVCASTYISVYAKECVCVCVERAQLCVCVCM